MNQNRLEIIIKRAVFMFSIMFPILLVLEYTGNSSLTLTTITAVILSGISLVVYPDKPRQKETEKSGNKNEQSKK